MERANYYLLAPEATKALAAVHASVRERSSLPTALIDLVFLRASQINGCAFCIDKHSRDLVAAGMSIDRVLLVPVWHEVPHLFSDRERAALRWAEVVTGVAATRVPDADYAAVSEAFEPREVVDLTFAVALMNTYNRLAVSFRRKPAARA